MKAAVMNRRCHLPKWRAGDGSTGNVPKPVRTKGHLLSAMRIEKDDPDDAYPLPMPAGNFSFDHQEDEQLKGSYAAYGETRIL